MPPPKDPRIDAYIGKSAAFAQPSHRREYITWLVEAKRDETRQKRLLTTMECLTAGKSRNWKYAAC